MKIIHYSFSTNGGAGKVASILHEQQVKMHLASKIVSKIDNNLKEDFYRVPFSSTLALIDKAIVTKIKNPSLFTLLRQFSGNRLIPDFDSIHHFHWLPGLINIYDLKKYSHLGLPMVWTLHDMWAFTGGCHYSLECSGYETGCLLCPQTKSLFQKIPHRLNSVKQEISKNKKSRVIYVAPSFWIYECAKKSKVLGDADVRLIPNPIDSNFFSKNNKQVVGPHNVNKQDYDFVIGCGAMNLNDPIKGIEKVIQAVEHLSRLPEIENKKILLVAIGDGIIKLKNIHKNLTLINTGKLNSQSVVEYLNLLDVFVHMPEQENFPNSVLEALSCQIPIVCAEVGGLKDIVKSSNAGYTVANSFELTNRLRNVVNDKNLLFKLGLNGRKYIESNLSPEAINYKYLNVYSDIVKMG